MGRRVKIPRKHPEHQLSFFYPALPPSSIAQARYSTEKRVPMDRGLKVVDC